MSSNRRRGNSSSKAASKQALRAVSLRCSTQPLWRPLTGDPPTIATPGSKYISRVYSFRTAATAGASTALTVGNIGLALSSAFSTTSGQYKIRSIKVWNSRLGGALTTNIFLPAISTSTDASIVSEDYGTGTSLAKSYLVLPSVVSKTLLVSTSLTDTVLSLSDPNAGAGIVSNFVIHLLLSIAV